MPTQINKIAKQHMKSPKEVCLTQTQKSPSKTEHSFVYCRNDHKGPALVQLIKDMNPKQAIVFCRSRDEVERVCRGLKQTFDGIDYLHAGLGQDMRTIITGKFRTGRIRILVATDVAARGLDFSGITHVFIFHLADDTDTYVHRSGRTGRNDKEGTVVTLVTDRELRALKDVLGVIQRDVKWIGDPPPARTEHHRPSSKPAPRGRPSYPRKPRTP